jgi:S-adenosylmethionine:tRNA ribosyltransferase-isomerase
VDVEDFDFPLPSTLIAQEPLSDRDESRLLLFDRASGRLAHHRFSELPDLLAPSDLLVLNDTRVIPARLLGRRVPSSGQVEWLLLQRLDADRWDALVHPGQKLKPGSRVRFERESRVLEGEVLARSSFGRRTVRLWTTDGTPVDEAIDSIGHVPLPPYIRRPDSLSDRDRYQTVYGVTRGSVAAPTAGLHFTKRVLTALEARGIEMVRITLHVGYGTFKPVRVARVEDHTVDPEPMVIDPATARAVNRALDAGRRVVAVGTTSTRALESAARATGRVAPVNAPTDLFIAPGFDFRIVGGLITNFHLPRSSLLMLVAAFAGRERILEAYRTAIARGYRFYSYGDAMLIT